MRALVDNRELVAMLFDDFESRGHSRDERGLGTKTRLRLGRIPDQLGAAEPAGD